MSNETRLKTSKQYDVCAIGCAMVDVLADCEDALLGELDIRKGGMTLIDEERSAFLQKAIKAKVQMSGGSVANTTHGVASLGGHPAYIGKVKEDDLGKVFRQDMKEGGVNFTTPAAQENELPTGHCLILVTPDAQRSMNTYLGCSPDFSKKEVDQEIISNSEVTFLEGYLFDKPAAKEALLTAARIAHEAGNKIAVSLSDAFCVNRHFEDFRDLVKNSTDILIANEEEIKALSKEDNFNQALAFMRTQCPLVVGTRSEKGAVILSDDSEYKIEAETVTQLVDSTGAGDQFAAGFLYGYTHGHSPPVSGRLGAIAASEVLAHYGPRPQENLRTLAQSKNIKL